MKRYLLDTNVIIDLLRQKKEAVLLIEKIQSEELYISVVIVAEYYQGAYRAQNSKKNIEAFNALMKHMEITILPIDREISELFGKLQSNFFSKGKGHPVFDLLIAATCIHHKVSLVTLNKKDFKDIPGLMLY